MKQKIRVLVIFSLFTTMVQAQNWLTDVGYHEDDRIGMYFGYVNQQLELTDGTNHEYWRGIWQGDQNKRLHGFVMGAMGQTNWFYGLGLYTGLGIEMFFSDNDPTEIYYATTYDDAHTMYMEFTLNIPIHVAFKIPITRKASLGLHTGLGSTFSWMAFYTDTRGYFPDAFVLGDDGRVKFYNSTWDFAVFAQIEDFRLDVQWSTGLNDHKLSHVDSYKTQRNKFTIGATIFID